eukprot:15747784-Heterocapsa_arctica.AAC.1
MGPRTPTRRQGSSRTRTRNTAPNPGSHRASWKPPEDLGRKRESAIGHEGSSQKNKDGKGKLARPSE